MQGYTRELDDSDDDDEGVAKAVARDGPDAQDGKGSGVAFEEQLILRLPAGSQELETLRGWVRNRVVGTDKANVELKFKGEPLRIRMPKSRDGDFHLAHVRCYGIRLA